MNIDYSFNYTLSQPADLQDKVDSYTAATYLNRGLEYDGRAPQYSQEELELFRNGSDPKGHPNVGGRTYVCVLSLLKCATISLLQVVMM